MRAFHLLTLALINLSFTHQAGATGPDAKNLSFSAKRIESFTGYALQFTPPAGHHFNIEAPSKITAEVGKDSFSAQLSKNLTDVKASWNKELTKCTIQAQLYLCDDKNSYCVPIKKTFVCESLTFDQSKAGADSAAPAVELNATNTKKPEPSQFIVNDSKAAFEEAKLKKKLILIDFFGIWCPPCNVLDETVFITREFQSLAKDFVFLKMDADLSSSWELKAKYNIKGYPTVLVINSEGEEILRIIGSRKPKAFVAALKNGLKYKSMTLSARQSLADSMKDPNAAFALADLYLGQESYAQALRYFQLGLKKGTLSSENRIKFVSAQIGLQEESKDPQAQKVLALMLKTALETDPYGAEAYERADKLSKTAEDLKDESLKTFAMNSQLKNAEYLLSNPKQYLETELSEADLYSILADYYEQHKDETKMKENYAKAYDAYTRQIKNLHLDENKERGNNLERTYALFKSGKVAEAYALYERLETQYPTEFTFYYAHAAALNEQGSYALALERAERALNHSYGDNMLRAVKLVADLRSKTGKKKEALSLLDETIKNFKVPEDSKVRTHRHLAKLKELKDKISKD